MAIVEMKAKKRCIGLGHIAYTTNELEYAEPIISSNSDLAISNVLNIVLTSYNLNGGSNFDISSILNIIPSSYNVSGNSDLDITPILLVISKGINFNGNGSLIVNNVLNYVISQYRFSGQSELLFKYCIIIFAWDDNNYKKLTWDWEKVIKYDWNRNKE